MDLRSLRGTAPTAVPSPSFKRLRSHPNLLIIIGPFGWRTGLELALRRLDSIPDFSRAARRYRRWCPTCPWLTTDLGSPGSNSSNFSAVANFRPARPGGFQYRWSIRRCFAKRYRWEARSSPARSRLLLRFFRCANSTGISPTDPGNPVDDVFADSLPHKRRPRMTIEPFNALYSIAPRWLQ